MELIRGYNSDWGISVVTPVEEGISLGSNEMGELHYSFSWDHVGAVSGAEER